MTLSEKDNHAGQSSSPETITNSDKFPEGLRVLAVDDDTVCLRVLEAILLKCHYKVTVTKEAVNALKMLRENKNNFDIVLTDVHMLDMDGFRLLEIIGLEMDIPVIMMSSNDDKATVMKGIEHGACDYLLKPIRLDVIKNIWQHVIRKSKFDNNDLNIGKGTSKMIVPKGKKRLNSQINGKKSKEDESNVPYDENGSTQRKPRVTWHQELHKKFLHAYDKLGPDKAVPSKILKEMNEPNLTRENIASHLQKYRPALKKTGGQQKNNHIGSNGMNEDRTNAASFNNQGSNGVNRLNGFKTNGLIRSQMNEYYGHNVPKPDAFSHSFVNPLSCLPLPSQPSLSSQQFPNNLEVLDENSQMVPVYGPKPSSLPLAGCISNSFPVNNSFDFSDYDIFDDANLSNTSLPDQNYSGIRTVQETLPGLHEGIDQVHMDMQNSNVEYPIRLEELPLRKDSFDRLDTDSFYHLSSCSFTDDDVNAFVKQSMTMFK